MRNYKDKKDSTRLRRGLKKVNIGEDEWVYGKQSHVPGKGLHMVIYGPDRKTEHHLWGKDVESLCTEYDEYEKQFIRSNVNRNGNAAIQSKVKIYILTSILDMKENWCFDLTKIPEDGLLKVIFDNGMIRKIDFKGSFIPEEIISNRFTWEKGMQHGFWPEYSFSSRGRMVNPVAYRLTNNQSNK